MSTLRNLREKKGLTVSQLAAKASIPSRVITEYEEGKQITLAHAKILAKALWVGIEDLMPPAGTAVTPSSLSQSPNYGQMQAAQSAPPPARPVAAPVPQHAPPPVQAPQSVPHTEPYSQGAGQSYRANAPVAQPVVQRPPRPTSAGGPSQSRGSDGKGGPARSAPKVVSPPSAISEGQLQELERLAAKLEIDVAQLEVRLGKKLAELTRPEAKDWIKRVRAMAEEIAPGKKAYGQWPGGQIDQEAQYLAAQKEAGAHFTFKLFNGEEVSGLIAEFTPYTITINTDGSGDDLVLRKLAVAYYKRTSEPVNSDGAAPAPKRTRQAKAKSEPVAEETSPTAEADSMVSDSGGAVQHQPLENAIDSDRTGEPVTPEADNMDEDRGV